MCYSKGRSYLLTLKYVIMVYVLKYSERPISKSNGTNILGSVELFTDMESAVKRLCLLQERYFSMFRHINTEEKNGKVKCILTSDVYPDAFVRMEIEVQEVNKKTIE